jgi:lipopolysaccharide export system permease protein
MLFDSTLRKDLSRSFAATLVVILTIVLTMFLIRTLGQAAMGDVSPQDVALLLGYTSLGHLPTILALSLFIAVVSTLSRMYRDSEMVVWFASGVSLRRFVRPVLRTAWPVLLVVALLALFVWPWINQQRVELQERFERRSDLARVAPGQFQSSADGSRVFFIERDDDEGRSGRNVFILTRSPDSEAVTTASTGHIDNVNGDRYLVLADGQRNEQRTASGEKTVARFESYRVLAGDRAVARTESLPPKATRTIDLIRNPSARGQGELAWRVGLVLGGCNLLLLGVGLAATQPRRASSWNLLFALLTFVVYYNLINLTQAWVAGGTSTLGGSLLSVHGTAFVLAWLLIGGRERVRLLPGAGLLIGRPDRAAATPVGAAR